MSAYLSRCIGCSIFINFSKVVGRDTVPYAIIQRSASILFPTVKFALPSQQSFLDTRCSAEVYQPPHFTLIPCILNYPTFIPRSIARAEACTSRHPHTAVLHCGQRRTSTPPTPFSQDEDFDHRRVDVGEFLALGSAPCTRWCGYFQRKCLRNRFRRRNGARGQPSRRESRTQAITEGRPRGIARTYAGLLLQFRISCAPSAGGEELLKHHRGNYWEASKAGVPK